MMRANARRMFFGLTTTQAGSGLASDVPAERQTGDPLLASIDVTGPEGETDPDIPIYIQEDSPPSAAQEGPLLDLLRQISDLRGQVWTLKQDAVVDEATGLHNRRYLELRLVEELSRAIRRQEPLTLVVLRLPERLTGPGAQGGDPHLLRRAAQAVTKSLRDYDVCCRTAERELMLLLPATGEDAAAAVIARVRDLLAHEGVAVCVGAATHPAAATAEELVQIANEELARDTRRQVSGEVEFASVPSSMVESRAGHSHRTRVWFEGFRHVVEVLVSEVRGQVRVRLPLSFLRRGSEVHLVGEEGMSRRGVVSTVTLGARPAEGEVPVLQLDIAALCCE